MAPRPAAEIDQPITRLEDDAFGFVPRYAVPLARRIVETPAADSLTIGVYGAWGSGKTSLMNLIRAVLSDPAQGLGPVPVIVWYTAWKYAEERSLWRTMVRVILDELLKQSDQHDSDKRAMREALYRDVVQTRRRIRIDPVRLAGALVGAATLGVSTWLNSKHVPVPPAAEVTLAGVALGGAAVTAFGLRWAGKGGEAAKDKPDLTHQIGTQAKELVQAVQVVDDVLTTHHRVEYIEQFSDSFELIVNAYLGGRKLVVFVDDLDRCLPEKAIQVLEGIKLFLGVPGTVFVLGLDFGALTRAIEIHYAGNVSPRMSGGRYLEKIIQFPFHLPSMRADDAAMSRLTQQLSETPDDRLWLRVGIEGFAANPRAVKRFAMLYRSRQAVMGGPPNPHLAKLVVLQEHPQWRDLVEVIVEHTVSSPRALLRDGPLALLERAALDQAERESLLAKAEQSALMAQLARFARDESLIRFLGDEPHFNANDVDPIDPLALLRLSGAASTPAQSTGQPEKVLVDLMSPDSPVRAQAVATARGMRPEARRQLVERLLAEVAGRSQSDDPDSAGMPEAVSAVGVCFAQEIERDLIADRQEWFAALITYTAERDVAARSRHQLIQLTTQINAVPRNPFLVSDEPATTDAIGGLAQVQAIAQTIRDTESPFMIGVYGEWGSGKSSILNLLRHDLESDPSQPRVRTEMINAWQAQGNDPLVTLRSALRALLGEPGFAAGVTTPTELRDQLLAALDTDDRRDLRLVVLVDDLDRCLPSDAVSMVETVVALAPAPLYPVIAADRQALARAFEERYGPDKGRERLERLVAVEFNVPELPLSSASFVESLTDGSDELRGLERFIGRTPREVKRYVNRYRLCLAVAKARGVTLPSRQLAVVLAVAVRWPKLFADEATLGSLWALVHSGVLGSRAASLRTASEKLELLDPELAVNLLAQEAPASAADLARIAAVIREGLDRGQPPEATVPAE